MLSACILIKVVPTKTWLTLKEIQKMKNISKTYATYGRFDIVAFLKAEDYKILKKITAEVNSIEGVRSTETLVEA